MISGDQSEGAVIHGVRHVDFESFQRSDVSVLRTPRHRAPPQKQETVMPSLDQVIVWVIVGLLGGSLAGLVITRERKGLGVLRNLGVGLVGALVGGLLFRVLGIFPGLDRVAVSLRDVVAALIGSLLVLAVIWLWQRFRKSG
jgi:uncharacterized membrane protein YeaQ/YmgE (transglycosylase-associated protein family)